MRNIAQETYLKASSGMKKATGWLEIAKLRAIFL